MAHDAPRAPRLATGMVLEARFKILLNQSGCQDQYPGQEVPQHAYIVQDVARPTSACQTLRILSAEESAAEPVARELRLLEQTGDALTAAVLVPQQPLWAEHAGARHRRLVYDEMLGPDLRYMAERSGPASGLLPASLVRKIARQALRSLAVVHSHGICHGGKSRSSGYCRGHCERR